MCVDVLFCENNEIEVHSYLNGEKIQYGLNKIILSKDIQSIDYIFDDIKECIKKVIDFNNENN